ncbi:phosphate ABC transporter substrate-binding protein PstS family protein [Holzapfeliella sp. He02]|uniref:Phosphate-binding protein n=1 Tax=Holzapfeliella saturejae TaxID=3082953 RepID=A0ABU8SFN8_9LACO
MKKKILGLLTLLATMFIATGCQIKGEVMNVVGSSALQPLVESAGESFSKIHQDLYVNVQGGGTGTGLAQVQAGAVDIGNSDLYAEEKSGIDASQLIDHRVAVVGITPIVNPDLKVSNLTTQQLSDIFSGKITNWKELGGDDLPITVINRAQGSGTRVVFESAIFKNGEKAVKAQEQDSSGMVRQIVATTPGAISYSSYSYINDTVKTPAVDGVVLSHDTVIDNRWKIWAYEHMYIRKDMEKERVHEFLNFILSDDVQDNIVNKMGYIAIKDMKVEKTLDGQIKSIE